MASLCQLAHLKCINLFVFLNVRTMYHQQLRSVISNLLYKQLSDKSRKAGRNY